MSRKNLQLTIDELIEKVKCYNENEIEIAKIKEAYEFAALKHQDQKRLSGDDYIQHPLNVAYILADNYVDYITIMAGLLHGVIEDTDTNISEVRETFGSEIADIVEGITKINRISFSTESDSLIQSERKILVGLCEDVRVIFVKLADRLHNMRTMWMLSEEKQKRKAKETLEILVPIAHRIGIHKIKSELEDYSLRYLKPDVFYDIAEKLNKTKFERDKCVYEMMQNVSNILTEHNIKHEIKGRSKSIYSIYTKLCKGRKFDDIYDFLGLRVFVETEQECYLAVGLIHAKYKPIPKRFKDFIAIPKANMYQSLHTSVFGTDGNIFEIQVRTYEMDRVAEYGIASHWSYKEKKDGSIQNVMEQKLQFFRSIIELNDEKASAEDFVNTVKDEVLNANIYAYTPKGDVIELPTGATPIDFAYKVHTGVGDRMVGAIVNNAIAPLDYQIQNGDIVKINTNKNSVGPSKEWLNIVRTTQARNKIKAFFNRQDKDNYIIKGQELLAKELRKRKLPINETLNQDNMNKIIKEFGVSDFNEIYYLVGTSYHNPSMIVNLITDENKTKEELLVERFTAVKEDSKFESKNDIIVAGIDEIKVNLASCCKPVKNDDIIGYITKGNGITVHRSVCHNVKDDERIISVEWNQSIEKAFPTTVVVHTNSNHNIMIDLINKTTTSDITIDRIATYNRDDHNTYEIVVMVKDKETLDTYIASLKSISTVVNVTRLIK